MKRKLLSIVLALTMALGMLPAAALAEGEGGTSTKGVAKVGETEYPTLQAAIDKAAKNATVTLLADTRENVTISTPYVTLDLNGHTLNGSTGERKPALTITARVTVKDSSEGQTGTIMREDTAANSGVSSHYVIDVQGSGWLTFESGTVKNGSGAGGTKGASLVRVGDDSVAKYPGLNIKGGTFTQDNFIVIKVDRGDLFLNGGTLNSANSYAVENWLRATIKGGTVNGNVSSWTYSKGSNSTLTISGGTVNGDVEAVSYDGAEGKLAKVEITGGTVNGTLSTKRYNNATAPGKDMATIEITGGTFSRDPSAYLVEGSTATPDSNGTYGVAKAYLAQVGETSYYTMDEAFKAQTTSGEAIVLLRDYTTGSTFNSGSINRTVDLNGHTWTCTGTDANSAAFEINYPDVTLTVKNGKIVSSQLVGLIPSAMGGTIKYDNSGLVFENVEMSTTATSGIETNGNNTNDTVTLINSTLNVPNGFGIYFPSSGKLTIDNSTINAKTMGVQVCAGSLSINAGSTITVSGDAVPKTEGDGAIQDGAAISIVDRTGYKGLGTVAVTGGKFTAKAKNDALKAYKWENQTEGVFDNSTNIIAVSGGTFTSDVSAYVPDGYIYNSETKTVEPLGETNAVAKIAGDDETTYYKTLADAVTAADNTTVTLLKDTTENVTIPTDKTLTLDLNGKTLSGGKNNDKAALLNNGTVTIKDSSATKTGTIKREDDADKTGTSYYVIKNLGTMTIEQANVINNSGYKKTNPSGSMVGSSLICNGDSDDDKETTLTINDGVFDQQNFIAIKNGTFGVLNVNGGKITSQHSAIQNWYKADIKGGEISGQLWTDAYTWDPNGVSAGETKISGTTKFTGEIVMDITGKVKPTLEISGGEMNITNWRITSAAANAGAKPVISGGLFSTAPEKAYLAEGHFIDATTNSNYPYCVTDQKPESAPIAVTENTEAAVHKDVKADDKQAIQAALDSGKTSVDGVANAVAPDSRVEIAQKSGVADADLKNTDNTITVDIKVDVTVTASDLEKSTLTFAATPVATVKVNGTEQTKKVPVTNDMLNGNAITVKLPLPEGFKPEQIKHTSSDNSVEYFINKTEDPKRGAKTFEIVDGCAVFEITKFSTFELSGEITYVEPSSSSSSRYDITVDKASHGTVSANSSRAFKGDTVTVTVKPDSGYVLETITVLDKDGKELTLTDKGNGKYTFTMPRGAVTVKATFMEDNTVLNFFYDVPNDAYYYEAVKWAVEKGITSGVGNDLFGSNDPCTRAQIVPFLWRAAGSPEPKALSSFTDVPADAWYAKAVAWAVENGVTAGVGDDLFGSGDTCTRAQSVTFLFKALKAAAKGEADFKDVSASDWYAKAVAWAVENGVTAGVGGGLFGSGDDCTRAQIVTFLFKAYQGK